jgi:hypothetical protein
MYLHYYGPWPNVRVSITMPLVTSLGAPETAGFSSQVLLRNQANDQQALLTESCPRILSLKLRPGPHYCGYQAKVGLA